MTNSVSMEELLLNGPNVTDKAEHIYVSRVDSKRVVCIPPRLSSIIQFVYFLVKGLGTLTERSSDTWKISQPSAEKCHHRNQVIFLLCKFVLKFHFYNCFVESKLCSQKFVWRLTVLCKQKIKHILPQVLCKKFLGDKFEMA